MSIFFQHVVDGNTKLAVWKIEEEEDFFLKKVMPQTQVTHPYKKLQHLAGRYLLPYLFPDFPVALIQIADTRKPYLEGEPFHFSISHSGDYAAAIVSRNCRVGIDIELVTEKIKRISHKFITRNEQELKSQMEEAFSRIPAKQQAHYELLKFQDQDRASGIRHQEIANIDTDIFFYTLVWSCKEAVFKWFGLGGLDFLEHMEITGLTPFATDKFNVQMEFRKTQIRGLQLQTIFFNNICLSWVVGQL